MNDFKIGDIVIFTWKPNYGLWRKGKIVANNFAMCNLPDFFGTPEYYITELDENDNVIDAKHSFAIDKDSKYIVKFEPGMEWCIGKSSSKNWPKVRDFEKEHEDEMLDMKKNMRPFDMILVCINGKWEIDLFQQYINKDKTQIYTFKKHMILHDANWQPYVHEDEDKHFRQLFNVDEEFVSTSHKDPCGPLGDDGDEFVLDIEKEFPEQTADIKLITIKENEELWKERIEQKLDDIAEKLNTMLLKKLDEFPSIDPYIPPSPWYKKPYYDPRDFQVWCDTKTHNDTSKLEAKIKPGDPDYIMRCNPDNTTTTTITFDYKKYNDMCTCTDANFKPEFCNNGPTESTMFGNEVLDNKYDTWGLAAASKKINNNNQNKK